MIGPLAVGKKAAKFGYRRFGKAGAVVFGAGSVGGYFLVKRKLKSRMNRTTADADLEDTESEQRTDGQDGSAESDSTESDGSSQ